MAGDQTGSSMGGGLNKKTLIIAAVVAAQNDGQVMVTIGIE